MRRIKFDDETIEQIRNYMVDHNIKEVCNKFTLTWDVLRRVCFEYNIKPNYYYKTGKHQTIDVPEDIPQETINLVCNLYATTCSTAVNIRKEAKIDDMVFQYIIHNNFSEEYIKNRKSKLYRKSKSGDKNPMYGKCGHDHPNYMDILDDGAGYLMVHKPDWYTGRTKSAYIYYHHYVFCKETGMTCIPQGFCIHHIDRNPKNNDITNLALLSIGAHAKLHNIENNMCKVQRLSNNGVGNNISETPDNT